MLISKFLISLKKILSIFGLICILFSFLIQPPVYSQSTTNPTVTNVVGTVGFTECNFAKSPDAGKSNQSQLQKCISQIINFFFIVALFLIAIRIAIEAFQSINPLDNSAQAINKSVKLVGDIFIGLLLIGAPSIFLSFFGTAVLNYTSFINLTDLRTSVAPTTVTKNTGTNPTNGTGSGGSGNGGTTGTKKPYKTLSKLNPEQAQKVAKGEEKKPEVVDNLQKALIYLSAGQTCDQSLAEYCDVLNFALLNPTSDNSAQDDYTSYLATILANNPDSKSYVEVLNDTISNPSSAPKMFRPTNITSQQVGSNYYVIGNGCVYPTNQDDLKNFGYLPESSCRQQYILTGDTCKDHPILKAQTWSRGLDFSGCTARISDGVLFS
jgi:hypothetical protein